MSEDDIKFIKTTEHFRSASNYLLGVSISFLAITEFKIESLFFNWEPSSTVPIVLSVMALTCRAIAIDRFQQMSRQQDLEKKDD